MVDDDVEFNINNFIDLFLEDGPFEPYLDEVYGIVTHNYQLKIYNATFKKTIPIQASQLPVGLYKNK